MIPGETFPAPGTIVLNKDRKAISLKVANTGDRPIQVGSHYHFAETNAAFAFDRRAALGCRLDIPAGDGRWLKVQAAAEVLVEIRHRDPHQLMRLAWHLGNRHLPTEIQNQVLRIRPDHVIEDILRGFWADLVKMRGPFQPEGGAYGGHGHITIMTKVSIIMNDERCRFSPLALLRLLSWLSPAFLTGSYRYSHGLEWAVEAGHVRDRKTLVDWLEADFCHGSGRNEAIFFSEAWCCAIDDDRVKLFEIAELAAALRGTSEFALESSQQATASLATLRKVWPIAS